MKELADSKKRRGGERHRAGRKAGFGVSREWRDLGSLILVGLALWLIIIIIIILSRKVDFKTIFWLISYNYGGF